MGCVRTVHGMCAYSTWDVVLAVSTSLRDEILGFLGGENVDCGFLGYNSV
jgi:hypothetical protein